MIDVLPIEQRLEHRIAETERHDILHRVFAHVVIDPIDLLLHEKIRNVPVQLERALQIVAERLLDDHASPRVVLSAADQSRAGQFFHDRPEILGCGRQIKKPIARQPAFRFQTREPDSQLPHAFGRRKIGLVIEHVVQEVAVAASRRRILPRGRNRRLHLLAKGLVVFFPAADAHDGVSFGHITIAAQSFERGHEFSGS